MDDLIRRSAWLAEYDRVHVGPPGGARKLMEDAPAVNAVELPCKIGDAVYAIRNYRGTNYPKKGIVHEMFFTPDMELVIVVHHIARGLWGKTIFPTKADALKAIGERKENETD